MKPTQNYIIIDWASNVCFHGKEFETFDDAESFLSETLDEAYESDRGEYYIETNELIREARYLEPNDPRSRMKRGVK